MTNQCGNGNYLSQPAWDPKPLSWYSYLWTVFCSYWMPGTPLHLRLDKTQKRELKRHVQIAFGLLSFIVFVVLMLAYGQSALRGY